MSDLLPPGKSSCDAAFGYPQCMGAAVNGARGCTCQPQKPMPKGGIPTSVWATTDRRRTKLRKGFFADRMAMADAGIGDGDVVRYDLADPERDKADVEAIRLVNNTLAAYVRGTEDDDEEYRRAARRLVELAFRLEGGAR